MLLLSCAAGINNYYTIAFFIGGREECMTHKSRKFLGKAEQGLN